MSQPVTSQLTEADQQLLLQIARNAVQAYLEDRSPRLPEVPPGPLSECHGVFVTLHNGDKLRGCIGNIHAVGPVYRTAAECAIAAAVGDPRFMPLTREELSEIEFEISVLSPLRRVANIQEIEIGKHGLYITKRNARGLLLPQVAAMYDWNREMFLQETCKKAGLHGDDWKDATIEIFTAVVFSEKQFHLTAK